MDRREEVSRRGRCDNPDIVWSAGDSGTPRQFVSGEQNRLCRDDRHQPQRNAAAVDDLELRRNQPATWIPLPRLTGIGTVRALA
jgi:hypothetical protein